MRFAYGADCAALEEGRIAATQTLSGTGACRIAGEFYKRYLPEGTQVYLPDPTWGNHVAIMQEAGLEVKRSPQPLTLTLTPNPNPNPNPSLSLSLSLKQGVVKLMPMSYQLPLPMK